MLCKPAQYLLRIDDLCPAVASQPWHAFAELIAEFRLKPILAVVPGNCDPDLDRSPADPAFWTGMREMQSAGAAIALHGYRHVCAGRGRGLAGWARRTEFAGVDRITQRQWIAAGLRILRGHGLDPRLWVAPRHGFDRNTLLALKGAGIEILCDGFAQTPHVREGMTWIPQQLWSPIEKKKGLWTILVHPNTAREEQIEALRAFVRDHRERFTSVERVLVEFPLRRLGSMESLYASLALARVRWWNLRKGAF